MTGTGHIRAGNKSTDLGSTLQSNNGPVTEVETRPVDGVRVTDLLNCVLWRRNIPNKTKTLIHQASVPSIVLRRARNMDTEYTKS
jgi:hypothetical protein